MEYWNDGRTKYWKDGMMEEWENGRMQELKNAVKFSNPLFQVRLLGGR
jgi:hypothetical protein